MNIEKDEKLKKFVHEKMKEGLINIGRDLVKAGGVESLSARKLAQKANSSVGMIYNIFGTMDNYIAMQNAITLQEVYQQLGKISIGNNPFNNLNRYADVLSSYILANQNLWSLLYNRHLTKGSGKSSMAEARVIKKIDLLICMQAAKLIGNIGAKEKRIMIKVLEMSLFALSGYLLGNKLQEKSDLNKNNLCKLLMNTYVAGLYSLR